MQMITSSWIAYSAKELSFTSNSFGVFEQPTNYFKWWERFGYMLDACRTHRTVNKFFHQQIPLVWDILRNQLPYFYDPKKVLRITPLDSKPTSLPFSELPSSKPFLNTHGKSIEEVLASGSYPDIQPLRDKIVSKHQL
jgi:hypothetical protein